MNNKAPRKELFLPLKHLIGLAMVAVVSLSFIIAVPTIIENSDKATANAIAESQSESVIINLTQAIFTNDKEMFIGEADNDEVKLQLSQIWDGFQAVNIQRGIVDISTKDAESYANNDFTLIFYIQMGFDNARQPFSDGTTGTKLTNAFFYDIKTTSAIEKGQKITKLTPQVIMPWDTDIGVYAEKRENSITFGYADEAELIQQTADTIQNSAANVINVTGLANNENIRFNGFPAFITANVERYLANIGEETSSTLVHSNGVAIPSSTVRQVYEESNGKKYFEMYEETKIMSTVLPAYSDSYISVKAKPLNEESINEQLPRISDVAVHEFAHIINYIWYDNMSLGAIVGQDDGGTEIPLAEGYATYIEHKVGGTLDRLTADDVKNSVVNATWQQLDSDIVPANFRDPARADLYYRIAGSYLYYATEVVGLNTLDEVEKYWAEGFTEPFGLYLIDNEASLQGWQDWLAGQ